MIPITPAWSVKKYYNGKLVWVWHVLANTRNTAIRAAINDPARISYDTPQAGVYHFTAKKFSDFEDDTF